MSSTKGASVHVHAPAKHGQSRRCRSERPARSQTQEEKRGAALLAEHANFSLPEVSGKHASLWGVRGSCATRNPASPEDTVTRLGRETEREEKNEVKKEEEVEEEEESTRFEGSSFASGSILHQKFKPSTLTCCSDFFIFFLFS